MWRLLPCLVLLPCLLLATTRPVAAEPFAPADIRVGVVASEDFDAELARWRECFSACSAATGGRLRFRIAPGTYGDLLHWMDEGLIDLAIVTPAVFAESQVVSEGSGSTETRFDYLATSDMRPALGPWAMEARRRDGHHYTYRAVCVVPADSPFNTFADLARAAGRDEVRYIFADPLSVSGRIAPEFALREAGIVPAREAVRYAFSHTGVLRLLAQKSTGRERVGFVWDDAVSGVPELVGKLRKLPFPTLEGIEIPTDVVAIRRDLPERELLSRTLLDYRDPAGRVYMERLPTGAVPYAQVRAWSRAIGLSRLTPELQSVSLDEIGQILQHFARSQPTPPRLAVVLSGGGAKCAYQAGAVAALEEKLERTKELVKDHMFDIDLVVGTSGGAVNALPIAMGVTRTAAGRAELRRLWPKLDQRVIVRPSAAVRGMSGLWLALLEMGLLLILVRWFVPALTRRSPIYFGTLFLLAAAEWGLVALPWTPWRTLGDNHVVHHVWLWLDIAMRAAAGPLLLVALGGLVLQSRLRRRGRSLHFNSVPLVLLSIALLVLLPILLFVTAFFLSETLSGGEGLERTLADSFQPLIEQELARRNLPPLVLPAGAGPAARFVAMSRRIFADRLLVRDLVVTANALEQSKSLLPSDLYFYAWPVAGPAPFGPRGIRLDDHPDQLLDVIMGSSSVFPLFPPRRLSDFPVAGESVDLVDGGFAHNSPIEAAVLRGATHIILIESTPEGRGVRTNLAANLAAAFAHLHKQTQLIDLRSKRHVVIFTLVPKAPHLCTVDFTDTLIERAVERGYHDARGEVAAGDQVHSGMPSFRKELGEPVFSDVPPRP